MDNAYSTDVVIKLKKKPKKEKKMNKYYRHLKTIIKHKIEVGKVCFKFGLYKQGLTHDLSKFSFTEFAPSARYFQGGSSPIDAEKKEKGYSAAWLHHKSKNKHHQWYWMDWDSKQNPTPCRIPREYVYEMIADWIGAGKVYGANAGKEWNQSEPYEYYKAHNRDSASEFPIWEFTTKAMLDFILVDLKEYGLDYVADRIRRDYYGYLIYDMIVKTKDGEIYPWLVQYNELVLKYYEEDK